MFEEFFTTEIEPVRMYRGKAQITIEVELNSNSDEAAEILQIL